MWSPTSTPDGFWPHLRGDGRKLSFGNARCYVADFTTAPPAEQTFDPVRAWGGWFMRPDLLTFVQEGDHHQNVMLRRWEVDVPPDGQPWPAPRDMGLIPPLSSYMARDGHWSGFIPWGQVIIDGAEYAPAYGGHGASIAGNLLLQFREHGGPQGCFRIHNFLDKTYRDFVPRYMQAGTLLHRTGWFGFGYSGPAFLCSPDLKEYDVTVTPWRVESAPLVVFVGDEMWLWSGTEDPVTGQAFMMGRPFEATHRYDQPVILVPGVAAASFDVAFDEDAHAFRVAGCDAVGRLYSEMVPVSSPRQVVKPRYAPYPKKFFFGAFFAFSDRPGYGNTPDYPQNITVVVDPGAVATAAQVQPLIISVTDAMLDAVAAANVVDRVLMLYIASEDLGGGAPAAQHLALEAKQRWATKFPGTATPPVLWYVSPGEVHKPGWSVPSAVDIVGPEFYFPPGGENSEQLWRKTGFWLDWLGDQKPWIPIVQAYDRRPLPGADMDQVTGLQPKYLDQWITLDRRIGRLPPCVGTLFFSVNRPGGTRDYPMLRSWHEALFEAIPPGLPEHIFPVPPLAPPRVTIVSPRFPVSVPVNGSVRCQWGYEPGSSLAESIIWQRSDDQKQWVTVAKNHPSDPDHEYVFPDTGDYFIRLIGANSAGTGVTGLERRVTVTASEQTPFFHHKGI